MSRLVQSLVAVLLVAVTACGPDPAATTASGDPLGPLEALADCQDPPKATAEAPEGLVLPEGTVVQQVTAQDPLTTVVGYVPMTPTQFQAAYDDLDVEILTSENEVYEAEMLIGTGTHRNYLKAAALCRLGSALLAVVAPEGAEGLPQPARATVTPSPLPPGATPAPG